MTQALNLYIIALIYIAMHPILVMVIGGIAGRPS